MAIASKQLTQVNDEIRWDASEALAGVGAFNLTVDSGTPTVVFEARVKGSPSGAWTAVQCTNLATGAFATSATASSLWRVDLSGQLEFRVRMSVVGTVTVYPGVSLG